MNMLWQQTDGAMSSITVVPRRLTAVPWRWAYWLFHRHSFSVDGPRLLSLEICLENVLHLAKRMLVFDHNAPQKGKAPVKNREACTEVLVPRRQESR